jgi:UDP-galactopyranose mutase
MKKSKNCFVFWGYIVYNGRKHTQEGKGTDTMKHQDSFDCLVVGAGFAGAVAARELASRGGRRVLVLEQRDHIGGNAYDCYDKEGLFIHQYGPHIFHTNDKRVYDYLSQFTRWRNYQHKVVGAIHGQLLPIPFNFNSLHAAFPPAQAALLEQKLMDTYGAGRKVTILELRRNPDADLKALAEYVYQNVFVYYTQKQWGTAPDEIDPSVTARVPVLLSRDDRYFQDMYQGMPEAGYTKLFEAMLDHPNITVETGIDAKTRLQIQGETVLLDGVPFPGPVIYTGAVDALFDHAFGQLPYRTLDFVFETHPQTFYQTHGTVNYTVSEPYTRITEFKHLTGQVFEGKTTIVKEYSRAYTGQNAEIPYYAILNPQNLEQYEQYRALAAKTPNLYLLGRLAEYRYYNMDAIVAQALSLSDRLLKEQENKKI